MMSADTANEFRRVPFVNEDDVGAIQRQPQVESLVVNDGVQPRVNAPEIFQSAAAILPKKILPAPGIPRFIGHNLMAAGEQFGRDPTEKMSVPVVPI
jgi:hypothetical protein